ncbi:MAG: D-alanyl-lipoteichoic acid biosynthesis protein DltD [Nostocales cyanobacterium 94392]|nr:D-alanyl-lipoteichoic acid biosynthesis protein DltD [Nostocales cyanobacterium 94392]
MKTAFIQTQQSLAQWVSQATGINSLGVKVRLRGNDLHILCESQSGPARWQTLSDLLQALQQTDLDALVKSEQSSIYQVFVYGKKKSEKRPEWCHKVYLNQLDKHLEEVNQVLLTPHKPTGALILSNESLARQGDASAIARYLSETLSTFGVAVQVKIRKQKPSDNIAQNQNRLWVFCQSNYTPDPSLIAEPVAAKLRHLKLLGYRDAVISTQVVGETQPDWLLLIDLTPPEEMLKEWARWGDVQAIVRLLNLGFANSKVKVQASLQDSTLHIFCTPGSESSEARVIPAKTLCLDTIVPSLEALAPQGILSAAIYGQQTVSSSEPAWIDWLCLPAKEHPALATPAIELANSGDLEAITFLLQRLLNPNLDKRLKTGGIRVILLRKQDLLHIMCDAPVCPARKQVAAKVINFIKHLQLSDLGGVRVYGRRAGNKKPFWQSGTDFKPRQRVVPEATPEFAATSAYVQELLPNDEEPVLRPDLTTEEIHAFVADVAKDWGETVKNWFLRTQFFTEKQPSASNSETKLRPVALIWGSLGLLLSLQTDWLFGQILTSLVPPTPIVTQLQPNTTTEDTKTALLANTTQEKPNPNSNSVFNGSNFTNRNNSNRGKATATAILLAARSPLPTFNARQLDEQLALYKQRLLKNGTPPDVLIIGSSRALRGVDPDALKKALATEGYPDVDIFNFGINGATAQVVDFVIRRVLQPSELPHTIIWADGSRAFNSGRGDNTFEAIAASPGYQYALKTSLARVGSTNTPKTAREAEIAKQKSNGYEIINEMLNEGFATISSSYKKRDQLKGQINKIYKSLPIINALKRDSASDSTNLSQDVENYAVDFDGFLPLSIRFDPNTYYQKHPKVVGNYDQDYQNFDLIGEQNAALQALLNYTESQNINVVFINMPLTADYLDPVRTKYEQEFEEYMLSFVNRSNFVYRNLSQIWLEANDYFSDPSHLNRYGAYEVSKQLAKDPMIPWSGK